jgi:hypothetical protein
MSDQKRRLRKLSLLALPATLALATSGAAPNDSGMTGGGSIFDVTGSDVVYTGRTTHGFELHCDTRNPNNLQSNWGGNRFRLQDLQAALCFDDPTISNPPDASFDTFNGVGVGKYNGIPDFCANWLFTDTGEPGVADTAWIAITNCRGTTILVVSGPLVRGNHRAYSK